MRYRLETMNIPTARHLKILFSLWAFQGFVAFFWLLAIPTDAENPLVFGFSIARLTLVGIVFLPSVLFALLSFRYDVLHQQPVWLKLERNEKFWDILYLASLSTVLASIYALVVFDLLPNSSVYSAYAARLRPLLLWFGFSGLECAVLIGWNRYEQIKNILGIFRPVFINAMVLLGVFSLLGLLIAVTGIGTTPEDNWGGPPVPFFEWQILLTLLIIGALSYFPRIKSKLSKFWPPALIYLFAIILWSSQPVNPSPAATPPRAPNFEIYPFSDPQFYAQYAQSALTGNGFLWPEVPARPFYVAVLTWLHLLGNQNYENVIFLQSLLLAFFPVVLFLLGREIGGWHLGLGLSLLTVFRDINSNNVVLFANNVTYSKLFLSELPAALFISLAALLSLYWQRSANKPAWYPLLIGGVLGVAALIRLQSVALVVVIILMIFFTIPNRKQWIRDTSLLFVGLLLTITPWIIRNYYAVGGLILDNPISQTMTMARRWSGNFGNDILPRLPGENDAQYSSRLTRMALESFLQNPGFILRTAANHFVNSEITSLMAFPIRDEILSPAELLLPRHVFWKTPVTINQIPLFAVNLLLFVLGVTVAWRRLRLAGILPLGLGLVYNLWTALFFSSGVRFIVPVDWSVQLYQFYGLLLFCGFLISFTKMGQGNISNWLQLPSRGGALSPIPRSANRRRLNLTLVLIVVLGAFTPFTEFIFPQMYPLQTREEIIRQMGIVARPGEVALYGRAVYPRYYESDDGEPGTAKLGYGRSEQARLVFFLVGSNNGLVVFGLDTAPEYFPHASDVYMVGTYSNGFFSPRVVMVTKNSRTEVYEVRR